ncbi:AAA family ATPase [Nakamurella leprariae]|uniref:AAA family ATPase n=1 Tax=Nakamurella leprariae TaxID=2803911 RepID=A0A938YAL0_9ACTN|nr:AAA family ATPase [Nakamurella leprariae]MBM9466086.1 AAA family ATPase [Nakamurella leprariae]
MTAAVAAVPTPAARRPDPWRAGAHPGSIIFSTPEQPPAMWGHRGEVLWAEGESLLLVGTPGVGKTTLAGQLLRGRLGLSDDLLGYPIRATSSRVLYLAMDRPGQVVRSLRRQFHHTDERVLADRLVIWKGPPPVDLAQDDGALLRLAEIHGADTVVVDSLKDAAVGLTEDIVGAAYNRARQVALAAGVQVLELHHTTKRGPNGAKPTALADVYGSAWITAGAGSVLMLIGDAGDPVVSMHHLKQPAEVVGPLTLQHDAAHGSTTVVGDTDPRTLLRASGARGVTAKTLAEALFGTPDRNAIEKARRKLDALVRAGAAVKVPDPSHTSGGTPESVYVIPDKAA